MCMNVCEGAFGFTCVCRGVRACVRECAGVFYDNSITHERGISKHTSSGLNNMSSSTRILKRKISERHDKRTRKGMNVKKEC